MKIFNQINYRTMLNKKVIILALLFLLSPKISQACSQLDSTKAIPAGFGAAYDFVASGYPLMVKTTCVSPSVNLEAGNGSDLQLIYKYGYYYRNGAWEKFTFTNVDPDPANLWIKGKALGSITLTDAERAGANYVVAYVCTWTGTKWKCGCRDNACTTNYWQLQIFQFPTSTCVDNDKDGYDNCKPGDFGDDGKPIDCNDSDKTIYPGAPELCDGKDHNCNNFIDEGCTCVNGRTQPCGTGVGACRIGTQTCTSGAWGSCTGGVTPQTETCDGIDNNCNGTVDENCACINGKTQSCGSNIGACKYGTQTCANGAWGTCTGGVTPTQEICGDKIDNNCNGTVDEGCTCTPNWTCGSWSTCLNNTQTRSCNDSNNCGVATNKPALTQSCVCTDGATQNCGSNIGACKYGTQTCTNGAWGTCIGGVTPVAEVCGDKIDNNCNKQIDEDCAVQSDLSVDITNPVNGYKAINSNQGASVSLSFNGLVLGGTPPYSYNWNSNLAGDFGTRVYATPDPSTWSLGDHKITFTATDSKGTVSSKSIIVTIVPANTFLTSINMSTDVYSVTQKNIYFYSNTSGGTAPYTYTWNSSLQGNFLSASSGSVAISSWTIGTHKITLTVKDSAGGTVVDTKNINIVKMTADFSPNDGNNYEQMWTVWFNVNVNGGTAPFSCSVVSDLDGTLYSQNSLAKGNINFTKDNLSLGLHNITFKVTDSTGLVVTKTNRVQISPLTPIKAQIISPTNNFSDKRGDAINFNMNSTGGVPGNLIYSWKSDRDGIISSNKNFSINNLSVGTHQITATVTDSKGNSSSTTITVIITNPDPLTETLDKPISGATYLKNDDVIDFSSLLSGGVVPYSYSWSSNIDGVISTTNKFSLNNLSVGTHTITLTGKDAVGTTINKSLTLIVKAGCQVNNVKNSTMYQNNEAFMISDSDWRKVFSMVPVTTWKDGNNIYSKPSLIYHEETGKYDADSIINFLQRYAPTRLTTINITPSGLNNLLVAAKPIGAGMDLANIQNRNDSDYFAYWNSFNTIVVVDYNNYAAGLIGSILASNQNSPIIFVNSANLSSYQSVIDGNKVYTVGDLDATTNLYINTYSSCRKSFSIEELQKWYAAATGTNKLILLNPNDNSISFSSTYTTKKSGTVSSIYSKMSLAAPFLAAAKEEVVAFTSLPTAGSNSGCSASTVVETNVAKADTDAHYAIQNIFSIKPEFLTIIASPLAIPDSKYKSCLVDTSWQFRTVEDWRYGSLSVTDTQSKELKTGRIYGVTVSDASAYIARSINFDYLNSKIYNNSYSLITIGHDFDEDMNYAKNIRDIATNSGYLAVCYTGSARVNCTTALRPSYDLYKMRNYIGYADHGGPDSWWNTLEQDNIPDLDIPISVGVACLTHNFWQSTAKNFGAHILRRGGIANIGATGVSWTFSDHLAEDAIRELSTNSNTTLGEVYQKTGVSDYYSLLGDPTIKPKFKSITW